MSEHRHEWRWELGRDGWRCFCGAYTTRLVTAQGREVVPSAAQLDYCATCGPWDPCTCAAGRDEG